MSFLFPSWETAFSEGFHEDAKAMLEGALNKGNKPPVIQGRIEVVELSMGTQPPTLTLLEIGDLSLDRFRGIFRLGYQGDAWLEVRCRVQANPLSHNPHLAPNSTLPLSTPLLASQPLLVPMTLRLSLIHLRAILILVVSATKGITLVFKNDPLQNVDVSSTFDSVEVIRGYLQQEIEGQLREMFREDLPGIIHRLSQRWFMGGGVGGKVETPYVDEQRTGSAHSTPSKHNPTADEDPDDPDAERDIFPPYHPPTSPTAITTPKRRASQRSTRPRRLSAASESPTSYTVFPDIEDYDPTYGLRPEGLPTHSGYEAFGRLWEKAREGEGRGLGGIMGVDVNDVIREESEESDWDGREADDVEEADEPGNESLDMVELEESLVPLGISDAHRPGMSRQQSRRTSRHEEDLVEYETIPAVGGGTITRPRVYHSQSRIRAPSEIGLGGNPALPSPSGSITARASSVGGGSTIGIGPGGRPGLPKSMTMSGLNTPLKPLARNGTAPPSPAITNGPSRGRRGTSVSGLALPGPGPSSLRRSALVQNRQDVFSPHRAAPASHNHPRRTQSSQGIPRTATTSSSAARTSMGSSHDGPSRTNTLSTMASSQIPSRSMSISGAKSSAAGAPNHSRHMSGSFSQTGGSFPPRGAGLSGITLPLNNSVSQLATLSHSNHTLSPYARGHEHIAVRSFPHLGRTTTNGALGSGAMAPAWSSHGGPSHGHGDESVKMRAKRKRIFRLGSKDGQKAAEAAPVPDDVDDSFSPASASPEEHPSRRSSADSKDVWRPASRPSSVIGLGLRTRPPAIGRSDSMASYGFPVVGSRRGSIYGRLAE